MFFRRALLLSALLHGLLVAFLFFPDARPPKPPEAVFVELPTLGEEGGDKAPLVKKSKGPQGAGEKRAAGKGAPKDFQWTSRPKIWEGPGTKGGFLAPGLRAKGEAVFSFADSMDLQAEGKFFPFAEKLYRRIDSFLGYPPDFVEENLEGNVLVHFLIDSKGRFTGRFLEVEGDEEFLKIYTMAMIALALKEPIDGLPETSFREIPVAVNVQFQLLLPDEFPTRSGQRHFKNTMAYRRIAFTEPKISKEVKRLIDKYMPPVIPVPGGFFVDFVALYKHLTEKDSDDPRLSRSELSIKVERPENTG